jgi:NAD(P)H-hydrate epimerase
VVIGDLVFTRGAVGEVDRLCVQHYGIPSLVLMENAAIHAAAAALRLCSSRAARIVVVCGRGNNGGDGLAMARHLSNARASLTVVMGAGAPLTKDAETHLGIVRAMGIPVLEPGVDRLADVLGSAVGARAPGLIVDAVFGTGLRDPVRGSIAGLIEEMNRAAASGTPVLAVDIPSGLDADTGVPLGVAVRATRTVTFVGRKQGFLNPASAVYTGDVEVAGIGAPLALVEKLGRRVPV